MLYELQQHIISEKKTLVLHGDEYEQLKTTTKYHKSDGLKSTRQKF